MNVPSLTSSKLTDDLADAAGSVTAPVVRAAGTVTSEAVDLAGSLAGTVAKGGAAKWVVTDGLPAGWGLVRRHPMVTLAALLAAILAMVWRQRSSSSTDITVTTERRSPVKASAA